MTSRYLITGVQKLAQIQISAQNIKYNTISRESNIKQNLTKPCSRHSGRGTKPAYKIYDDHSVAKDRAQGYFNGNHLIEVLLEK